MKVIAIAASILLLATGIAQAAGDNFNDNSKSKKKWGADKQHGHGLLLEKNKHLEYICKKPTGDDEVVRSWKKTLPYTSDWDIQIDLFNNTTGTIDTDQINSFGIKIRNQRDKSDEIYAELYADNFGGAEMFKGFDANLETNNENVGNVDSSTVDVSNGGAVRVTFDSTSKVITVHYDLNPGDGYTWVQLGSFGIGGSGGEDGTTDWGMSSSGKFTLALYGYSSHEKVTTNQIYGDNFIVK